MIIRVSYWRWSSFVYAIPQRIRKGVITQAWTIVQPALQHIGEVHQCTKFKIAPKCTSTFRVSCMPNNILPSIKRWITSTARLHFPWYCLKVRSTLLMTSLTIIVGSVKANLQSNVLHFKYYGKDIRLSGVGYVVRVQLRLALEKSCRRCIHPVERHRLATGDPPLAMMSHPIADDSDVEDLIIVRCPVFEWDLNTGLGGRSRTCASPLPKRYALHGRIKQYEGRSMILRVHMRIWKNTIIALNTMSNIRSGYCKENRTGKYSNGVDYLGTLQWTNLYCGDVMSTWHCMLESD